MQVSLIPLLKMAVFLGFMLGNIPSQVAQVVADSSLQAPPALQTNRAEEDYAYLKDPETNPYQKAFGDPLKFIALDPSRRIYLTVGGGYRARLEHFTNQNWIKGTTTYYSQRLSLHTALNLGKHLRFFGELYHGSTSNGDQLFQSDTIAWHQGFIEFNTKLGEKNQVLARLGRQELVFGATRLVGRRDGTNMRRSFDLAKVIFEREPGKIQLFYGKEVNPQFGAFDNAFSLFNGEASNPQIWGIYIEVPVDFIPLTNELYYIGFRSPAAGLSDVFGEEIRHTIGLRRVGNVGKQLTFNTELIYQFGRLGESKIRAFNIETDWKYIFTQTKWRPIIGLKLEFSSGDRAIGDDRLQTFNPLFVNPAIYSLAAVNTPANLTNIHPSITFFPAKNVSVFIDFAWFFRTTIADGLYTPPRFQIRTADGFDERHIGDALGGVVSYTLNRNISMSLVGSYFIPAGFIKVSGPSAPIFFFAPTLTVLL